MDGLFPVVGMPAFTNQKIDLAAATAVVGGDWPVPIAWVDGSTGVGTKVGTHAVHGKQADHPMRIVYESLFACGPPTDGNWDAPTLLYAVGDVPDAFSEAGQGGAAVINPEGGLAWDDGSTRPDDLYVHVADQAALNARIDRLLGEPTRGRSAKRLTYASGSHSVTTRSLASRMSVASSGAEVSAMS